MRLARPTPAPPSRRSAARTSPEQPPPAKQVPIGVFVTCVTNHADTYDAVFGYENDNRASRSSRVGLANTFARPPGIVASRRHSSPARSGTL